MSRKGEREKGHCLQEKECTTNHTKDITKDIIKDVTKDHTKSKKKPSGITLALRIGFSYICRGFASSIGYIVLYMNAGARPRY